MNKTIMIVGHPYWNDSVANKAIVEEFLRLNPDTVVSNLAELYQNRCQGRTGKTARSRQYRAAISYNVV